MTKEMEKITITRKERIAQDKKMKKLAKKKGKKLKTVLSIALATTLFTATAATANAEDCDCIKYSGHHLVHKGDTYYSIAKKYGLTARQLMDANFTDQTTIYPGQKLMIPAKDQAWSGDKTPTVKKPSTGLYKVVAGDTLYAISKRTGASVVELMEMNNLLSSKIYVGQMLEIHPKRAVAPLEKLKPGVTVLPQTTYVVKAGNTKYGLQKKFGKAIILPTGELKVGQRLPVKGDIKRIVADSELMLADGRVVEVRAGHSYHVINVYEGNHYLSHLAYRTDIQLTLVTVQVGDRKELVSYEID